MYGRYDYVIVGGGSAGCVLANRLSAGGRFRVCLLEAGPRDSSPLIRMPAGVIALLRSPRHNWQFWTLPQAGADNRRLYWPRGRTLGGSSSINAMCAIRGNAWDYDHWAALGNAGWSHAEVLPYFRRMEDFEGGEDAWHGRGGPLAVSRLRHVNPLSRAFLAAAQAAGHPANADFNGAEQAGFGEYHVFQRDGERCSNAAAYLRPAERRSNLEVITGVRATRVLFEGRRAVGVRYFAGGVYREVHAAREVVLSAGAIGSPQLLLLSGIGPAEELRRHAIVPLHALAGVGHNLQDHVDAFVCVHTRSRAGYALHPLSWGRALRALFQYLLGRRGELTSNIAEVGGFLRSDAAAPAPDLQFHFVPLVNTRHALDLRPTFRHYGFTLLATDLRPRSRGVVRLASADPEAPPEIDPRCFDDPRDLDQLVVALRRAREILAQPPIAELGCVEVDPGPQLQSDDALRDWLRRNAETLYHPVGTCKMGSDPMAVVDARLRVHGVQALRVVDASIMPTLVGGNTNAPTTMIAEKGADMILADATAAAL